MMAAIALGFGLGAFAMVVIGSLLYADSDRERADWRRSNDYDWNSRGGPE